MTMTPASASFWLTTPRLPGSSGISTMTGSPSMNGWPRPWSTERAASSSVKVTNMHCSGPVPAHAAWWIWTPRWAKVRESCASSPG